MTMPDEESKFGLLKKAEAELAEYNKNIISSWLERATPFAKLERTGPEYATIEVSAGGNTRIFGLCFGKTYRSPRALRINPLCFDAFGTDDVCEIEKIKLIGFFAEHMDEIAKEIIGTNKAKKLYRAWANAWNAIYKK